MKRLFILSLTLSLFLTGCSKDITANDEAVIFEIVSGDTVTSISKKLYKEGIIANISRFRILVKLKKKEKDMKVGIYKIEPNESYLDLIEELTSGRSFSIKITIPEGYNIFQIAEVLSQNNLTTKEEFLKASKNPDLLERMGLPLNASLEGYLFPDTYYVPINFNAEQIAKMFLDNFDKIVNEEMRKKIAEKGYTINEILTMASIIEKESSVEFEKPIISGVFYKRLRIGMKLQADPTLIYALTLAGIYEGDIRFRHFDFDSPYNTYRYYSLPPFPIANPGKTSILAAIFPADVEYIFFVANPNDGTHVFSKTLAEHNRNVDIYQRNR